MKTKHSIISLSGGMDSTCLLLQRLLIGDKVKAYSFDYGQKHSIELKKVKKLVKHLQKTFTFEHEIINVRDIFRGSNSALLSDTEVPKEEYNVVNLRATVVPIRNVIFANIIASKALNWAREIEDDVYIYIGAHSNDDAVYPDCREASIMAVREAIRISDEYGDKVKYVTPFINMTKGELLDATRSIVGEKRLMRALKHTHSCYDPVGDKACGKCATCRDRLAAFEYAELDDPIAYVD